MLEQFTCETIPELAEICKKNLFDFCDGKLTFDQFMRETAYVALNDKYGFDDYHYRPDPAPPQALMVFRRLGKKEREAFVTDNPRFFLEPPISDYLDARDHVRNLNYRYATWLREWLEAVANDPIATAKIKERLVEFEDVAVEPPPDEWVEKKREFKPSQKAESVRDMFKGRVV